jgi:two-component system OmpR family sensor kinase/two-component system sensor histidine kinase BaeS
MNRLRVRLILSFTLVVLVAVGTIALLVIRTTNAQFRQYITHSGMQAAGSGLQQLIAYHEEYRGWEGVESVLEQGMFISLPEGMSLPAMGRRPGWPAARLDVILADANGRIVYDSAGEAQGQKLRSGEKSQALPITQGDNGEVIGYLLLSFPGASGMLGALEQRFLDHMQQILITGAALAVGVGLAIGALLSQSLTAPLQRLAAAARAVALGDLSQQVDVEGSAEMVEVAQAFNDMTTALGESERQRQNMVADVAHELRTPLTVIQGNLRAILDDVYPLDQAEISRLYDETRLLSRLVDDLRELALADAGQLGLHLRPADLVPVIRSTMENLAPAAEAEDVTLTAHLSRDPLTALADPDRVAQVLRNLLINALRHSPGGSVRVTASLAGNFVEIGVTDTGEGIAPQDLPHVFERFWRADLARARTGSTGLGLSVAQSLVETHGGRIWAESTLGEGSTFRFTLPAVTTAP